MSFLIEKYAFRDCCTATLVDPDTTRNTLRVDGPCIHCNTQQSVTVPAEMLIEFGQGGFAQDCFPMLSADQREFLISGICSACWDEIFAEVEGDDE